MNKELVINVTQEDTGIALLEDKKLIELSREKHDKQFVVGDLYLGRVKRLVPGLNAAFVDVGYERDAFLHYFDLGPQVKNVMNYVKAVKSGKITTSDLSGLDILPDINKNGNIKEVLKGGQEVLVQIAKEPISTKGPRISTELSIAGRYIVLVPFTNRISVSTKIKNKKEKDRLRRLLQSIKPENFGVIIRTVAENRKVAELDKDLRELLQKWEICFQNLRQGEPKQRVLGELDQTSATIRDLLNDDFNSIHINDKALYGELSTFLGSFDEKKQKLLKLYKGKDDIFEAFDIERQIKAGFGKHVTMSSGAYLVIEHTEALHVIDVNSGNTARKEASQEENAVRVNLESATEIARQLRLRDMGGIIVVDFIDMQQADHKKMLFNKISEVMKQDRAKHYILPPSKFGLVQITRQRVRPEMEIRTAETIPSPEGEALEVQATILLVDEIENKLFQLLDNGAKVKSLEAHPFVAAYLRLNRRKFQWAWLLKYKKWIKIVPRNAFHLMKYDFLDKEGELLKW